METNKWLMSIAKAVAKKSKDPSSQVGCVIVDQDNKPISFGYNGFVAKCDEDYMTYSRPMKYLTICHAEMNAIIFAQKSVKGGKLYTTHAPCENCLKYLLQAGISKIFYESTDPIAKRGSMEQREAIIRLLKSTHIICQDLNGTNYIDEIKASVKEDYGL